MFSTSCSPSPSVAGLSYWEPGEEGGREGGRDISSHPHIFTHSHSTPSHHHTFTSSHHPTFIQLDTHPPPLPPTHHYTHIHTHTHTHTHAHTHAHTHTHTHTQKQSKKQKQSVSLPLSGHAIWHSQNARALSGPLSQCNATSWSRARNSQVD